MTERFLHCRLDQIRRLRDAGPAMDIIFLPEKDQRSILMEIISELVGLFGKDAAMAILGRDYQWQSALEASDFYQALTSTHIDTLRHMLSYLIDAIDITMVYEWIDMAESIRAKANGLDRNIRQYAQDIVRRDRQ